MAEQSIDYEKVISDLEAKRAAFNAAVDVAIQNMRFVMAAMNSLSVAPAAGNLALLGHAPKVSVTPGGVTPDAFFGLGIAEAAIKYLQIVKRQQTSRDIADALEGANYHHTSQNFVNTVNTALYRRERDEKDVVKIGRNWALAEWYPGRRKGKGERPADEPAHDANNDLDDEQEGVQK